MIVWRTDGASEPNVRFGEAPDQLNHQVSPDAIVLRVAADVAAGDDVARLYLEPREDAAEVVAAFPDMQGRLVGKRFHAEFFLGGAHEETHGCDYLLANDIDMEPVPGYAVANWEKGYGDFVMKPDLSTLRRIPWLPATAPTPVVSPRTLAW